MHCILLHTIVFYAYDINIFLTMRKNVKRKKKNISNPEKFFIIEVKETINPCNIECIFSHFLLSYKLF